MDGGEPAAVPLDLVDAGRTEIQPVDAVPGRQRRPGRGIGDARARRRRPGWPGRAAAAARRQDGQGQLRRGPWLCGLSWPGHADFRVWRAASASSAAKDDLVIAVPGPGSMFSSWTRCPRWPATKAMSFRRRGLARPVASRARRPGAAALLHRAAAGTRVSQPPPGAPACAGNATAGAHRWPCSAAEWLAYGNLDVALLAPRPRLGMRPDR